MSGKDERGSSAGSEGERGAAGASPALADAMRVLLRPLVRLFVERQLTYPAIGEIVKEVMLEVVRARFSLGERRLTDSRVSLLTGVHRKEVRRLREARPRAGRGARGVSLGAWIVSRWTGDPRFLTPEGGPRDLPRNPPSDGGPSFEELVHSTTRDTTVRSVLDEWVRLGIAEVVAGDVVRLRVESFVPAGDFDEKLHFFGRNLRDHAAAGVHNLLAEGEPLFDRSVYYDRLSAESVAELRGLSREIGARALREMNQRALELQRRDADRPAPADEASHRMTFGAYYYDVRESEDEESADV